jgi:SpoVK/Ycf46/Vps4 family AAA+-type ATPase
MGDVYRADRLGKQFKEHKEEAKKAEKDGRVKEAVQLYERCLDTLENLKETSDGSGHEQDLMIEDIQNHIQQLKASGEQDFSPSENSEEQSDNSSEDTDSGTVETGAGSNWDQFQPVQTDLDFRDVGGRQQLKNSIREDFINPVENPEKYRKYDLQVPNGILFHGPPGTGKTFLAKALGGEIKADFVPVNAGELRNKYVGETESNTEKLFEEAKQNQPVILFFDEADQLMTDRSSDEHKANLTNTLLKEIDDLDGEEVFVVASSNRPSRIDPAILRPGRIGESVKIGYPPKNTRRAILSKQLEGRPVADVNLDGLVKPTYGYSAADLEKLVDVAARKALGEDSPITDKHLKIGLEQTSPSKKK